MMTVAITGGIGSGKSTVSRVFENLGVPVYYTDPRAKELMNSDWQLSRTLRDLLGEEAYTDGVLNRVFVASKIFTDRSLIGKVNALVHPAVGHDFVRWTDGQGDAGEPYVILESAILYESGFDRYADYVLNINAPLEERIARASSRDGIDPQHVRDRMGNQMSDQERAARADFTVDNSDWDMVLPQLIELHNFFRDESRKHDS